jgi:predicted peroxiredoxin
MDQQGLINDTMAAGGDETITPDQIKEKIQMPENLQEAYDRVVLAGMKILFDKSTNQLVMKSLDREGSIGDRIGEGVAGLMSTLFTESNATIPPQVMIPAGIYLVSEAADFLRKAKVEKVTDSDVGDAMARYVEAMIRAFGGKVDQLYALLDQFDNTNVDKAVAQQGA